MNLFKGKQVELLFKSIVISALLFKSNGCGVNSEARSVDSGQESSVCDAGDGETCGECVEDRTLAICVPELTVEHCIGYQCEPVFDTCGECVAHYSLAACYIIHIQGE